METKRLLSIMATICLVILLSTCGKSSGGLPSQDIADGAAYVSISFEYTKQSGHASNQFAVWIEDLDGNMVRTLYATQFTANGGYQNRPDAIPTWVEKSGLPSMDSDKVDVITSATPKAGELAFLWDLTDQAGNTVPAGDYNFFVEGSLRWKNRVLYSGTITIGDSEMVVTVDGVYSYEATDQQPALSEESPENEMIGTVTARYVPA